MSATTQAAENYTPVPGSILRTLLRWARIAIEAYAQYRVKSAVSPSQLEQVEREMRRYRRLMRAGH